MPTPPSLHASVTELAAQITRLAFLGEAAGLITPVFVHLPKHADQASLDRTLIRMLGQDITANINRHIAVDPGCPALLVHGSIVIAASYDDVESATRSVSVSLLAGGACTIGSTYCGQLSSIEGRPSVLSMDRVGRPMFAFWHDYGVTTHQWNPLAGRLELDLDGYALAEVIRNSLDEISPLSGGERVSRRLSALADKAELAADAGKDVPVAMIDGQVDLIRLQLELTQDVPDVTTSWTMR